MLLCGLGVLSLTPASTWAVTPGPAKGTGLYGAYYATKDFSGGTKMRRTDRTINFDWGLKSPYATLPPDSFSILWSGEIEPPVTGDYAFATEGDDGARLWVNGRKLIDDWETQPATKNSAPKLRLEAGRRYSIRVDHFEAGGTAAFKLLWSYPGQPEQVIPQIRLYPPASVDYLSDLPVMSSRNGLGPVERDMSNGGSAAGDGRSLVVEGVSFAKGLGVAADSEIVYDLARRYDDFRVTMGVDDTAGNRGSVVFEIWVDGVLEFTSPMMRGDMPGQFARVDVTGHSYLKLVVKNGGDGGAMDLANWADAHLVLQSGGPAPAPTPDMDPYLSELAWKNASSGWGPIERDLSNGEQLERDGKQISIAGRKYTYGLGVHSKSEIVFDIDKDFSRFVADVGVDDEVPDGRGSVIFQVFGDSTKMFESTIMRKGVAPRRVDLNVVGVQLLKLVVLDGGDGPSYDHANWANAKLYRIADGVPPPPGGTLPGAPSNLTPIPANGRVTLEWSTAAGATSYNIYRGLAPGAQATAPIAMGVTSLRYIDTAVTNGVEYYYKVAGVNNAGIGPRSNEAKGKPQVAPPSAPGNLTATTGNTQVSLGWNAVQGATSYLLYRGTTSGGQAATPVRTINNGTSVVDTGLTNGTKYYYKVAAANPGGIGPRSNEVWAIPNAVPAAPAGLTSEPGDAKIGLKWTAVTGAASYNVYRGTTAGGEAATPVATGVTSTSYLNTGLTNGTAYFFKVAAVNSAGVSAMSNETSATPGALPTAPATLAADADDKSVTLTWQAATGAVTYNVYRGTASGGQAATPIATNIATTTFKDTGLTNGTKYYYKVAGVNPTGVGPRSNEASATPNVTLPAPATLTSEAADMKITLRWAAVTGATSYNVYRGPAAGGQAPTPIATGITGTSYINTGVTNGTAYFYKVAAVNSAGPGAMSVETTNTPVGIPLAPANLTATAGNQSVTLNWQASVNAVTYNVYRGTSAGGQSSTPVATGVTALTFTDMGRTNNTAYFYKVSAVNGAGISPRSNEASATPQPPVSPPEVISAEDRAIWRLLRQATWGPTQADFDRVKQMGIDAWLTEQLNMPPTFWPDTLLTQSLEWTEEYFFVRALQGQDQLRQRVAWALSQIWVVSGVEVTNARAMLGYIRTLDNGAFGNFQDLMRAITLTPAMGEYLDMVQNKKEANGILPNENFARELAQLFTIGLVELNPDGSPRLNAQGQQIPTYTNDDILELARVMTGWTYGDTVVGQPTKQNPARYDGPMEAVESLHDNGAKRFLNTNVAAGLTASQDLDNALGIIFRHPNVGPFICRQLIQRLVSSNPSAGYIRDVAAVFDNNGQNVRGDLRAVVRAILIHPEAAQSAPNGGKLSEPVLYITRQIRGIGATVTDTPFMSDMSAEMAQRVFHSPSVFNYYSPGFRVAGTALTAPEFQIYTTATATIRANFAGRLVNGSFGSNVNLNLTPWTTLAADAGLLVNQINKVMLGGTMSAEMRAAMVDAIQRSPNAREKVLTALYLTFTSSQFQVEH